MLRTEGSEQGSELNQNVAQLLPNVGQNWTNFTASLPGISGSGSAISVNGTERYEGNWLSDGGNIVLPRSNNLANTDVFETIAEVQITTASFNAQYSSGTAVFNQITKSGTNQFHGSAYDYTQNDAFNARNFFSQSVPFQRWDNFGGSLGGRVIKDKLFFYYNYDTTLSHGNGQGFSTYPTADMRAGNFSNSAFPTVYDPNSLTNGVRTPLPGNQIPASEMDPVAAKIQAFLPTPNLQGYYNNFYYQTLSKSLPFTQFYRVDYNISNSNRLNASGTWNPSKTTPDSTLWSPTYPIAPPLASRPTSRRSSRIFGPLAQRWSMSSVRLLSARTFSVFPRPWVRVTQPNLELTTLWRTCSRRLMSAVRSADEHRSGRQLETRWKQLHAIGHRDDHAWQAHHQSRWAV